MVKLSMPVLAFRVYGSVICPGRERETFMRGGRDPTQRGFLLWGKSLLKISNSPSGEATSPDSSIEFGGYL